MAYEFALTLGVLIPLISFAILALFGHRIGKPRAGYVAVVAIGLSCLLSAYTLIGWLGESPASRAALAKAAYRYHWADFGSIPITVGVNLDSLTVIMYFMVTFVSFCIFFFSLGYMEGHSDEVDGQSKYHRFFTYFSLFAFSMLGLVISSSLLFLFIFWELVGLCSYLLIGFYFDRKYASDAAIKAFVTNRVGDFGFILGLAIVVLYLGTFDLNQAAVTFELSARQAHVLPAGEQTAFATTWLANNPELATTVATNAAKGVSLFTSPFTILGLGLATLMGIGLFCGAMGKSAQFPLHVWLPDAMAGPTPVSALIHAATMVAAGVYLVARVFRLLTPDAQMFVAVIGCITLTITALIAIVQTDIKKVLAYSTLSQLGYMIFGLGVGAWVAALFHLMTHAFFKAMLFLGSGQVIEGCHHEQDIRKMGGLRKKMPVTCWTFFVGVLAIAGFGIPAMHFGLGGYFSKDEILAVAYEKAFNWPPVAHEGTHAGGHGANEELRMENVEKTESQHAATHEKASDADHSTFSIRHSTLPTSGKYAIAAKVKPLRGVLSLLFYLPIIIAYITPFYMMRVWWLTFCGKPRDEHVYHHAHENWKMFVPLVILAIGTVFCSYWLFRPLIANAAAAAADSSTIVAIDGEALSANEAGGGSMMTVTHGAGWANPHYALAWIVGLSWLIGMGIAWLIYRNGLGVAERLRQTALLKYAHRALEQKLYFDHVYNNVLVGGVIVIGYVAKLFDQIVVDGLVNLAGFVTRLVGSLTGRQLDMAVKEGDIGLVDAIANGVAAAALDFGKVVRRPQTGRIRTYVLIAAGTVTVVLLAVLVISGV